MWPKKLKYLKWEESYLKYIVLLIFFIILMVFAIALLFVSNGVSGTSHLYIDQFSGISALKVSIGLTLISFVITLIAFIGCSATYAKSKLILFLFCILLGLLIILEIFCIYFSFSYNSKLKDNEIDDRFNELTQEYVWDSNEKNSEIVNEIQRQYNCCGTHSYRSWDAVRPKHIAANLYPLSCCFSQIKNESDSRPEFCTKERVQQMNSCFQSINSKLEDIRYSVSLMAAITITNCVIKMIGIPLLCYFGRQVSENFIV